MSPDVLLECPRTSFRDVLRVNVTERVWHSPPMLPVFVSTLVTQMAPPAPPPRRKVEEKQNPPTEFEEGGECWVQLTGFQGVV